MSKLTERLLQIGVVMVMVWVTWNIYDRTLGTILTLNAQLQQCRQTNGPNR